MNSDDLKKEPKKNEPKEWHQQQAKLLKNWAEVASSYRWMHNQAYMIYKKKNLYFMLPLIIMSTVAGTANFAQATFPESIRPYVPQIIGAINLIAAIMTTIYQFLKISEFMESHRISSINYGKLARTLTVELNLPIKDRNSGGAECVKNSRTEIDRLIEQSPAIPKNVLLQYERIFAGKGLSEPEIIVINNVDIYEDQENKVATTVSEAGLKFKSVISKMKKPLFQIGPSNSPTEKRKETVNKELTFLQGSKLVSNIDTNVVSNVLAKFKPSVQGVPLVPQVQSVTSVPSVQKENNFLKAIKTKPPIVFTEPKEPETVEQSVEQSVEEQVQQVLNENSEQVENVENIEPVEQILNEIIEHVEQDQQDEPRSVSDLIKAFKK